MELYKCSGCKTEFESDRPFTFGAHHLHLCPMCDAERKRKAVINFKARGSTRLPFAKVESCKYCGRTCESSESHGRCNKCKRMLERVLECIRYSSTLAKYVAHKEEQEAPSRPDAAEIEKIGQELLAIRRRQDELNEKLMAIRGK